MVDDVIGEFFIATAVVLRGYFEFSKQISQILFGYVASVIEIEFIELIK